MIIQDLNYANSRSDHMRGRGIKGRVCSLCFGSAKGEELELVLTASSFIRYGFLRFGGSKSNSSEHDISSTISFVALFVNCLSPDTT